MTEGWKLLVARKHKANISGVGLNVRNRSDE